MVGVRCSEKGLLDCTDFASLVAFSVFLWRRLSALFIDTLVLEFSVIDAGLRDTVTSH